MQADPLQQLKDIHLPVPPGWWPPAPGWWLLFALLLAGVGWGLLWLKRKRAKSAPLRQARHLYQQVWQEFQAGHLQPLEYLHQTNELLKRAVVFVEQQQDAGRIAASTSDQDWLLLLDQYSQTNSFSNGPGSVLGNRRFAPATEFEPHAVHQAVEQCFTKVLAT